MVSSTLAAFAAIGALVTAASAPQPVWQPDYRTALAVAAAQQKPVAVFIGTGGAKGVVTDGGLTDDAAGLLQAKFVSVAVDTATPAGQELAKSFDLTEGVVISDATGKLQALRHGGTVSRVVLTSYLTEYAAAPATVATTACRGTCAPVVVVEQPRPVMQFLGNVRGFVTGGCPGGNCPRR